MPFTLAAAAAAALAMLQPAAPVSGATLPIDLSVPTRVSATQDGRTLVVQGPITEGAYASFRRAMRANPKARRVLLESPGGLMFEADRIADAVRARHMSTYVEGLCASACTIILIAGSERAAAPTARIGFHRPNVSMSRTPQRTMRLTRRLYERAGIAQRFTARIYATPFETAWYPAMAELISAGVLTRQTGEERPVIYGNGGAGSGNRTRITSLEG